MLILLCIRHQKGWIDDDGDGPGLYARGEKKVPEDILQQSATREVLEEGGVEAKVVAKVETTKIFFTNKDGNKILKFITYYLMEYLKDVVGGFGFETSEVKWVPYDEARKTLSISGEKKILDKAKILLDSGIQPPLV